MLIIIAVSLIIPSGWMCPMPATRALWNISLKRSFHNDLTWFLFFLDLLLFILLFACILILNWLFLRVNLLNLIFLRLIFGILIIIIWVFLPVARVVLWLLVWVYFWVGHGKILKLWSNFYIFKFEFTTFDKFEILSLSIK